MGASVYLTDAELTMIQAALDAINTETADEKSAVESARVKITKSMWVDMRKRLGVHIR